MKRVAVIGAGPAGMMAAVSASAAGAEVFLIEKNEKAGKKLYITGKGRCNLTNACEIQDFFDNVVSNPRFLYSALYSFSNRDTMDFFEAEGLKLKIERGNRVFPASDKASDVTKTLERRLKKNGVRVMLLSRAERICLREDGFVLDIKGRGGKSTLTADRVIIATGGLSYPSTGSDGDGYRFAQGLGHSVTEPLPSLVPFTVKENFVRELEGLSLRNVSVSLSDKNNRKIYSDFGEMLFTSGGVSGPLILSASCVAAKRLAEEDGELCLSVDLKPGLSAQQLDQRLLRDFGEAANKDFKNSLGKLLPSKLIPVVVALSGIEPDKKVNEVTKKERGALAGLLKDFRLTVTGTEGFERAVITQGGVNVKEINPADMQSLKIPGIYFAGEVLDVDAFTGGFNIQIALSTGCLAGRSAAED